MIAKHADLPTSKLVLTSESGFTPDARRRAEEEQAVALAPEDLDTADPVPAVLSGLVTLWPKLVTLTASRPQLLLRDTTNRTRVVEDVALDTMLYLDGGKPAVTLGDLVVAWAEHGGLGSLVAYISHLDHDARRAFFARSKQPPAVRHDGREHCLRFDDDDRADGWRVEKTQIEGEAAIEIGEIPLTHKRLGEIAFAYGTGTIAGRNALAVVTSGRVTVRVAPPTGTRAKPARPRRPL